MAKKMKRMALTLKMGQHVILPSGRAAKVKHIFADGVHFEYLDNHQRVEFTRLFAVAIWGVD